MAMVLAISACKVPVHFAQSPHVLVYSQHFSICANQSKLRDYLIDSVLGLLPTFAPPPKDIDKIVIRGSAYLQIGSVAGDPSAFTIDGHGWHRMYYGETNDEDAQMYLASADYFIANGGSMYLADLRQASLVVRVIILNKSYFSRAYLRAGSPGHRNDSNDIRWIDLLINQTIIREIDLKKTPEDKRFVHESQAVLRVYLLPLKPDGVFMIAPMKHEIGIVSPREKDKVYSVGCVEFSDISDEPKILDVRGRNSVWRTTDYPELLRWAGIHEHSGSFRPHWYGQSCADDERRPQYQAGARRSAQEWRLDREGKVFERLFDQVDDSTCNGLPVSATHAWTGDLCL